MNANENKILILGTGQLGTAFKEKLTLAIQWGRQEFNFEQIEQHLSKLDQFKPELIINTVAYTAVDKAETEKELADQINHRAVAVIADWCAKNQVPLVHFSTDYVYDGQGHKDFLEDSIKAPINFYGQTKLHGDQAIVKSGAPGWIFRVSWVFSETGNNFVKTMLRLFHEREELNVVSDQVGSPTSASGIVACVLQSPPYGIYHLRSKQICSWYDFAGLIKENAEKMGYLLKIKKINAISSTAYPTAAKRPLNSRLNVGKLEKYVSMPDLNQDLNDVLKKLKV